MNDSREAIAILFHAFCLREWRVSNGSETGTADCDFNCNNALSSALSHTTMLSSTHCCEDPEMGPIWCRILALKFLIDVQRREGPSLNDYFSITSTVYPELLTVYKEEYCSPASTASVERSFSIQGCYMHPRRSCLKDDTIRVVMVIRANCALGEKSGWYNMLLDHIKKKTMIRTDH